MGRRNSRAGLALVAGCLALLALAPLADASGGAIAGTVTERVAAPLSGIDVNVYKPGYGGEYVGSVKTEAKGEYTFPSLPEGAYTVEFAPNREDGYVPQYYEDEPSYENAQTVEVKSGQTTPEINAVLRVGGKITGTVLDSLGNPVKEARVEASGTNAAHEEVYGGSAETTSTGEYTLAGLSEGEYHVSFEAPFGANLVSQYFPGVPLEAEAKVVKVKEEEGGAGQEANAKLQAGGEIAGTVTDSVTHKPLASIVVYAYNSRNDFSRYGETNANGEYTIAGLEGGGAYSLEFFEESEYFESGIGLYIEQTDEGIGVATEATARFNAELVPVAPNDAVAPVASGAALVGHTLSCSTGSWTGVTPFKYAYKWLREGSAITGATGASYVVQSTDQGHALSCEVTATNIDGHASALSNALKVPSEPIPHSVPPPAAPSVSLASLKLVAHGSSARVQLSCLFASCSGAMELSEQIVVKHRHHGRTISRRKKVVLAVGSYSLTPGSHGTFVLHLTRLGKRLLAHARRHRIAATLVVTVIRGLPAKGAVLLKAA